jgi:type IV secretion system protein VirD4
VLDPKGEISLQTAEHRRKRFGHKIVRLDPYRLVTKTPDTFNAIDAIDKDDQHAIDKCRDMAAAIVVRDPGERERHWNDSAEFFIGAAIAVVVQYGKRGDTRSLQMVHEIFSHPDKLNMAVKLMCESDCWDGLLARMGGQLLHFSDKEKSSVLTTVSRHLQFLGTPAIVESTKTSSFTAAELLSGKLTVYMILPPDHLKAQSPLLRLWIASLLRTVISGGVKQ